MVFPCQLFSIKTHKLAFEFQQHRAGRQLSHRYPPCIYLLSLCLFRCHLILIFPCIEVKYTTKKNITCWSTDRETVATITMTSVKRRPEKARKCREKMVVFFHFHWLAVVLCGLFSDSKKIVKKMKDFLCGFPASGWYILYSGMQWFKLMSSNYRTCSIEWSISSQWYDWNWSIKSSKLMFYYIVRVDGIIWLEFITTSFKSMELYDGNGPIKSLKLMFNLIV